MEAVSLLNDALARGSNSDDLGELTICLQEVSVQSRLLRTDIIKALYEDAGEKKN